MNSSVISYLSCYMKYEINIIYTLYIHILILIYVNIYLRYNYTKIPHD